MKEILVFVVLCTSAVAGFAIAKEKICKRKKETFRVRVQNSDVPKPILHPTFTVYTGVQGSLNLHSPLTLPSGYSTAFRPWKTGITATTFWVGESPTPDDPGNLASAWDPNWTATSKGQNPFYVALPYNDVAGGHTKPEARSIIPWFREAFVRDGQSVLKDRWIAIRKGARVCYAQWEDVGPFQVDHWQYVFGNEMPRPNVNHNAGIDLSPAVRDYLEMSGIDQCDWKFVEAHEIPEGPWKYRDDSKLVADSSGSTKRKYYSDGRPKQSSVLSYSKGNAVALWNTSAEMAGVSRDLVTVQPERIRNRLKNLSGKDGLSP
ncbi:MAG: hypothetical protein JO271_07980 [Verrucomicrobia bacterium]|nr:hypothetical protein [Verrucomicrobiota bacterium]